jgi:hypothetical protein
MIPRMLEQLERAHREFSWMELCHGLLPCATVLRWRARSKAGVPVVEQPGVKKKPTLDVEVIKSKIAELVHGRQRTAGTAALHEQFADTISRRRFQELVAQERQNIVDDMKRIQWLLPGTAWSIDTTEYGPDKIKITPLRDLASKYQLPTPLVEPREDGKKIALYLDLMFKREGAPMFLKRDWGSPLNSAEVDEVLAAHQVLPLNSPPGYPRYNGSMERGMRDLHNAIDERLLSSLKVPLSVEVELATHHLNHRRLRSIGQRTPCQVYHDPARRLRLHGASRQRIFREVFEQFWHCLQCMPVRNLHTTRATWRLVVETWLRRQGWISITDKNQTNVSTDSKTFFSQN